MAATGASAASATGPSAPPASEPSPDAIASIITQVSPSGQPARAPARRRPAGQKPASSREVPRSTQSPPATSAPPPPKQIEAVSEKSVPTPPATATAPPPASAQAQTTSPRKRKRRKPRFIASLLAFLTCSAAGSQSRTFEDTGSASTTKEVKGTANAAPHLPKYGRHRSAPTDAKGVAAGSDHAGSPSGVSAAPAAAATVDAAALASQEAVANTSREGASLPRDETGDVLSGAVVPPGKEGTSGGTPGRSTPGKRSRRRSAKASTADMAGAAAGDEAETPDASEEDEEEDYFEEDDEDRLIMQGGMGIPIDEDGNPRPLLVDLAPSDKGRKCLVLDLDETLVHSSFKMIHQADYVVPVEIENQSHNVYVIKRPGVDIFLQKMGEIYEVVVFTASLSKYADPVLDHLDVHRVVKHRLFRESCYNHKGNYVKDLSQLGRPIGETIIIDNSPASYIFHPKNAVPVSSWFNDPHDTELTDLLGVLTDLAEVIDVRGVLDNYLDTDAGFGQDQSMHELSAIAQTTAQEHSALQHQEQQSQHTMGSLTA